MGERINYADAKQFVMAATVLLRDETPLRFQEVIELMAYCWRHTETIDGERPRAKR